MYQETFRNIHRLSRNSVELMLVSLKLIFIHSMATSQKSSHSLVSNVKVCEKGLVTLHVRFKKVTTHTLSVLAQTETVPIMSCLQVVSSTSFQVQMSKYEFINVGIYVYCEPCNTSKHTVKEEMLLSFCLEFTY